jgi:hypothetical protein
VTPRSGATARVRSVMFEIPWTEADLPHFILEVNDRCNITCRTCFKRLSGTTKSLAEIERDLDVVMGRRRVQTVSIAGGEPTLHPDLAAIVTMVHRRGLRSALITNGVVVDADLLGRLQGAGLDMVMFHVDTRQERPDLPRRASVRDVEQLRGRLLDLAAAAGLDAGLSFVVGRDNLDQLEPLVDFVLRRPEASYLLVTHALDVGWFVRTAATLRDDGAAGAAALGRDRRYQERTDNDEVEARLRAAFGLEPFAYLPATEIPGQPRRTLQWMNYFVPVVYHGREHHVFAPRTGALDRLVLQLYRRLAGRYVFYTRQDGALMALQLVLNALTSGRLLEAGRFLARLRRPGALLRGKRFAFDNGHFLTPAGEVACMEHCPNPTVRDGAIVPYCLADHAS